MYTWKEFVKNIIVISIYKEFETSKETELQYTQTEEMEIYFLYGTIDVDNTVDMMEVD